MTGMRAVVGLAVLLGGAAGPANAIELQAATINAWHEYVLATDARLPKQLQAGKPFLWTDETSDRRIRVRRGEVVVAPLVGRGTQEVPNGLIHDWTGAAFIPNTTIENVLAVTRDYDRYQDVYKPVVADSKVLACAAVGDEFSMTWCRRVLFVSAALEGQYRSHPFTIDSRRGYNVVDTTRIQEIENYGNPTERLLPPDQGGGFIWRIHSIAKYEERDGGVYLELEVLALTRDIPPSLRWLVTPVVNRLSVNSLTTTLRQTREAVHSLPPKPERIAECHGTRGESLLSRAGGEE